MSLLLQVTSWIESYRTLLDQWGMFSVRAELDIALTNAGCTSQPFQQVIITIIIVINIVLDFIIIIIIMIINNMIIRCLSAVTTAGSPSRPGTRGCPRGATPAASPDRAWPAVTSPRCRPALTARSVTMLLFNFIKANLNILSE